MNPEPVIQISALEHHIYCARQCALIHLDGIWIDNEHTVRGERGHRRADSEASRRERGALVLRSIPLWSEALGLTGRADVVEIHADGAIVPIEYKMGIGTRTAAQVQVCAQALCLEEMTHTNIATAYVWSGATRRRVPVALDTGLRQRTIDAISEVRRTLRGIALPAAPNDARCDECQLRSQCLPDLVADPDRVVAYHDGIFQE